MQDDPVVPDERREIGFWTFLKGYVLLFVALVVAGAIGQHFFGILFERTIAFLCGVLFTALGAGVPRKLYLIVRKTGWFAFIPDPRVMRAVLIILGLRFLYLSIFASDAVLGLQLRGR